MWILWNNVSCQIMFVYGEFFVTRKNTDKRVFEIQQQSVKLHMSM
jgi:hypothetical protein